jgi:predicted XRE-type DNA-binding protein
MNNLSPDMATVQALRSDVALQLARFTQRLGVSQVVAARQLGVPQPTLSKIINGRVSDLSLELLIRTAARAGLPMTLQTGRVPQEAGAFVSGTPSRSSRTSPSRLGDEVRES